MRYLISILLFMVGFSYAQPLGPPVLVPKGDSINGKREGWWKIYESWDDFYPAYLKTEGLYQNNERQGQWKEYDPKRKISGIGNYLNDEKQGEWKYYNFGRLREIKNYHNGKLHGKSFTYEPNGKLWTASTYHNGDLIQKLYYLTDDKYQSGEKLYEEEYYRNGKKHGEWKYYYDDDRYIVNKYFDGELQESKSYRYGVVSSVTLYENGGKNRTYKEFYTLEEEYSGNIRKTGQYADENKVGEWVYFNTDGSIWMIENYNTDGNPIEIKRFYDNGQLYEHIKAFRENSNEGLAKYFHKNGQLEKIGEVNEKRKEHGEWQYFDENGKRHKVEVYENGKLIRTRKF